MESVEEALDRCETDDQLRKLWLRGCLALHPDKHPLQRQEAAAHALHQFTEGVARARARIKRGRLQKIQANAAAATVVISRSPSPSPPSSGSCSPMSID